MLTGCYPNPLIMQLKKMKVYESLKKMGQKELPPQINSRVIEINLEG